MTRRLERLAPVFGALALLGLEARVPDVVGRLAVRQRSA